ncbi:uncharacterized protein EI97DRAFT_101126 [Westerdykella ornata]|uniref:Uncharacterized protein n=1 Tax=Westerdykella ornata TaxID=318751 RepID=A0A6A6JE02_WESOR|nr:uncharacterized protein EI97DRAFT_101126 [Westerdykella ornata]KAF2274517.1 hypothetical protein EI97DRAFT_101126 [Westerdykella ornata]
MCLSLLACFGKTSSRSKHNTDPEKVHLLRPPTPQMSPQHIANQIIDVLLRARRSEKDSLNSTTSSLASPSPAGTVSGPIGTKNWYSTIAEYVLHGMEIAIEKGLTFGQAMESAVERARVGAEEFVREHPIWAGVILTVIALGALYLLAPWIIEALGFTELGPLAGTWAASWQSSIGNVEAGSFFAFLQRLGMVGLHGGSKL